MTMALTHSFERVRMISEKNDASPERSQISNATAISACVCVRLSARECS